MQSAAFGPYDVPHPSVKVGNFGKVALSIALFRTIVASTARLVKCGYSVKTQWIFSIIETGVE